MPQVDLLRPPPLAAKPNFRRLPEAARNLLQRDCGWLFVEMNWKYRIVESLQFTHPDFDPHGVSVRVISTKRIFPFLILNASLTASVRGVRKNGGE